MFIMPEMMKNIIQMVATECGIQACHITGNSREVKYARPRAIAYHLSRQLNYSYPIIGKTFNKHHTTIIAGINRLEIERDQNKYLDALITKLERKLSNGRKNHGAV